MTKAFAELSPAGDKIEVYFKYDKDLVSQIKEVPGARYVNATDGGPMWLVPLNLDIARRLNEEMGPGTLVLGKALRVWGKEARKREQNLQTLALIDSIEPQELSNLYKTLPDMAKWMRGYQRADTKFLAATSAINANEQRLGKTPETIAAVFEAGLENGAHLVCAPRTALNTVWRYEIERWTEGLEKPHEVITYSGAMSKTAREAAIEEFWNCVEDQWPVWFICTYDTVRDGSEPYFDPKDKTLPEGWEQWNTFIIDEFHRSGLTNASGKKGTGSKFADAVHEVRAKRRYALSGTPIGGKPIKLWGALRFLYPDQFTSKWQWAKTWLDVSNNGFGSDIGNIQAGRQKEFYAAHAPYMVRRLRSEVLPQLPPAQWIDVWCEMTPKQEKQYKQFADAFCDNMVERDVPCPRCGGSGKLAETEVQCSACLGTGTRKHQHPIPSNESGKLPYLLDNLALQGIVSKQNKEDDAAGESLAIVSSQFKEVANMVHAYLNNIGIPSVKITGDTSDKDRQDYQMLFRQDGKRTANSPRVIVMTTTAGGVAITLDLCETVHILDETWVPDDQEQLADRAVNTSRMHQVGVYVYRSLGTIEEDIAKSNVDKAQINRAILDLRRQGYRADRRAEATA